MLIRILSIWNRIPKWGRMDGWLADLKSQAGRLEQALEEFVLAFLSGLYKFSRLRNIRLILVRQMKSSRFTTQAQRASGPSSIGSRDHGTQAHRVPHPEIMVLTIILNIEWPQRGNGRFPTCDLYFAYLKKIYHDENIGKY